MHINAYWQLVCISAAQIRLFMCNVVLRGNVRTRLLQLLATDGVAGSARESLASLVEPKPALAVVATLWTFVVVDDGSDIVPKAKLFSSFVAQVRACNQNV